MKHESNLVWVDCEMTGLNIEQDVILEIACVVTDSALNVIAQGPCSVINYADHVLEHMNEWCQKQHRTSGLYFDVQQSRITLAEAEKSIMEFVGQYCFPNKSPLCGSSVWVDRMFIMKQLPQFNNFLHYRNIDIAAIKEVVTRWYPDFDVKKELPSKDAHRAQPDIYESINELKFYRERFFVPTS